MTKLIFSIIQLIAFTIFALLSFNKPELKILTIINGALIGMALTNIGYCINRDFEKHRSGNHRRVLESRPVQ